MKFKGLRKSKVLKTAEDVLEHSYGRKAAEGDVPAAPPPAPPPPTPPPASEPPPEDAESEEGEEETQAEYAERLESENLKDVLVTMAEERELDSSGNKDDIAARIAEFDYSEE